jgi:glycosyltransferase involved in cell wall biosynthesis
VKVSVVIPAHNAADTLAAQLDGLRRQDGDVLVEVVVVDSASTDATAEVASRAAEHWPKVHLVRETAAGANRARNTGIRASTASAVLMCDADDVVADGWVAALAHALDTHDLVRGRYSMAELNDPSTVAERGSLESDTPPEPGAVMGGLGGSCGFRRSAWELLGGLNELHYGADDMEFFWRAHQAGLAIAYVPEAVVHYRLRPDLAALYRQQRTWASSRALLFKEFGDQGLIADRSLAEAAKSWAWVGRHLADRWSDDPATRGRWVRAHAKNVGRVRGSVRHRVQYL